MSETISDVDFSDASVTKVDGIQLIPQQDVEQAAREVARAAMVARIREFSLMLAPYNPPGGWTGYHDTATGDIWALTIDKRWICTSPTGAKFETLEDPTHIDPTDYQWIIEEFRYFHERSPSPARGMAQWCEQAKTAIQSGRMTPVVGVSATVSGSLTAFHPKRLRPASSSCSGWPEWYSGSSPRRRPVAPLSGSAWV
jgi:hypothetical protein